MLDPAFWAERGVLLTGHTGFKGSWLALWLSALGADVSGLSSGVPTEPSLYQVARVGEVMHADRRGDIREAAAVREALQDIRPQVVIHLAAQPLVRRSYAEPHETFETNVLGTANVLEAIRTTAGVQVVIVVSSDKCYENRGLTRGYREDDPLGGHDPYSASKAAAELVTTAYRRSFFADPDGPRVASARAGNVIAGGDFSVDRLVPDLARAVAEERPLRIRNPDAVRPWQHVLNPLCGYLILAQRLWASAEHAHGWNFGPPDGDCQPVQAIVEHLRDRLGGKPQWEREPAPQPHEAHVLQLDSTRARDELGWRPPVGLTQALDSIVEWYAAFQRGDDLAALTRRQLEELGAAALG